tara:strand:+ start:3192 stop:3575 length:384 start_codon:yes stop_codon:yes gene_type:complete
MPAKTDQELTGDGFTSAGISRYRQVIDGYTGEVHSKAVRQADAEKASDMPREVTDNHVRAAAHSIASSYGTKVRPKWWIPCHVAEYVFTAVAGVGAGKLDQWWGILMFGVGLGIAVLLIVIRLTSKA